MKRAILWIGGILVVLVGGIILAFRLSPWPGVAIIAYMFSRGDKASEAGLKKHVPAGVVTRRNIAYGAGVDETFDLNYPENTNAPRPTIVWVHGGGWVGGSKEGIANYLKIFASYGYTTVAVEYSRGFSGTYPKPVEQVNTALSFLTRNAPDFYINPANIVLAGDSAGAQIVSQLALVITDPAYARQIGISPEVKPDQIAAMLLLSGAYDLTGADFHGGYAWFLNTVCWAYSGMEDFFENDRFQLLSVTNHLTAAFPPSFVSSGNGDPLVRQARALAQKLHGLGVPVDALFFPADQRPPLPHEYQFNLDIQAGQEALNRMLAFLDRVGGRRSPVPPEINGPAAS